MRPRPEKRSAHEGELVVQTVDEDGLLEIGFYANEASINPPAEPNCGPCCHAPEPGRAYEILGRVTKGFVVGADKKRRKLDDVVPGNWID